MNSAISRQFPRLVPVPNRGGTGTTHQNTISIGTDPSGTGTTASRNPDFWYSYIVKLKFEHQGYKNRNKLLMGVQIRMKLSEKCTVPRRWQT